MAQKKSCRLHVSTSGRWSSHGHPDLSVRRQCELLGLSRSSLYYEPAGESAEDLRLMRLHRRAVHRPPLLRQPADDGLAERTRGGGQPQAGAAADAGDGPGGDLPKPRLSAGGAGPPDLPVPAAGREDRDGWIRSGAPTSPTCRWRTGFMYLAAVIDWYSRYVIAWRLSNTLDGSFCLEMLEEALRARAGRRCSTPTRGCSSRRRR